MKNCGEVRNIRTFPKEKLRRFVSVTGILAAVFFTMTGCGEQLVDMTEEEETKIVTYAAHVTSKFNKKQPDGIRNVPPKEPEEEVSFLSDGSTGEGMQQGQSSSASPSEEVPEGFHDPEEFEDIPTTTGTDVDAIAPGSEDALPAAMPMELSDVIGIEGFDMQWTGTEIADDFMDPTGSTLATPNKGNQYVILTVTIQNTTDGDLRCNVAELVPELVLRVNGSEKINASQMLVSTDFATFNQDVAAGESVDTNVFFQRKSSDIADSDSYGFVVTLNGVTGEISQR